MFTRLCLPKFSLAAFVLFAIPVNAQTDQAPLNLKVAVNEVELTFHAADRNGLFVNNLRLDELRLLDNDHAPQRIVLFESLRDLPIRAGILIDTSNSMEQNLKTDQAIAIAYAERVLERKTDQAFVMSFGHRTEIRQTWSNDPTALTAAIRHSGIYPSTTALFDSIYAACRSQFGKLDHASSGNFILIFSDGEDDASRLSLQVAVDMCQQTNTAIYAFRADMDSASSPTGARTLSQLASLTGGRVFRDSASASEVEEDLHIIQESIRNQYRLVYNPADLKRDGAFHSVILLPAERVAAVTGRSGYYAPKK
jgi:VWFA-related protein